ncbi:response regulator transcription factor [Clostridium estertheticum]|uniref:response regulator transcription factor n=1 Tax=Clostridium estertheticum TaxID=238834 RepID=UPI0013EE611B|nr:response regulator transcription factor [Clostridium estertheticum]MBZ9609560.1 response regulator transcription factor [Clostridium estertheticum]
MKQILVVEDDTLLNKTLSYNLNEEGYEVDSALNMFAAINYVNQKEYHLIILDVNLPDGNGFDLCQKVKLLHEKTSVIFLTSNDMEKDMIKGFDLGADDYVTKPFPLSVFQKKVKVLLNRLERPLETDCYDNGDLCINFSQLSANLNGKMIAFTPIEYRTLKLFTENPKIVLTRQILLEKLWDSEGNFVDEHTLTTVVSRIRNKIELADHKYIKTVYSMGYMWISGDRK